MKRRRRKSPSLPFMLASLAASSWETIARRTLLMAQNRCTPAEYRRMLAEKTAAADAAAAILLKSGGRASAADLIAPWQRRAAANAKRLRRT